MKGGRGRLLYEVALPGSLCGEIAGERGGEREEGRREGAIREIGEIVERKTEQAESSGVIGRSKSHVRPYEGIFCSEENFYARRVYLRL